MSLEDDKPIVWGDLYSEPFQALARSWVRSTMRTCIAFLTPFILLACALFAWYANRAVDIMDDGLNTLKVLTEQQAGMKEQISSNKEGIIWLRDNWSRK